MTTDKIQELRDTLGERLTTAIRDLGDGPTIAYVVDGTAYTLSDAVDKFLPVAPESETKWRTINPQSVSRALGREGVTTRSDYSKPGIRCMRGAFKDEVTVSVFVGDSGIKEQDDRDDAATADELRSLLTSIGYTVFNRDSSRAIFTVKRAEEDTKPVAEPAPETDTAAEAEADAAVELLNADLGVTPKVPALPTVNANTVETVHRPETLAEWTARNPKPAEKPRAELKMKHPEGENLTLF